MAGRPSNISVNGGADCGKSYVANVIDNLRSDISLPVLSFN